MGEPSILERLARNLNYAGVALLAAAALAFVWAVGFTRGVDALLEGLVVSGIGLFLPGIATLWVAWIIGSAAASYPMARHGPRRVSRRRRWLDVLVRYGAAVVAVVVAALVRHWLAPFVGTSVPYATFFLAVAVSGWIGGIGPSGLAVALSLLIAWWLFVETPSALVTPGDWVGGTLFLTVALAIAGITSALRVARSGNVALRAELAHREAQCDELTARLAELADQLPAMLWWCGPDGRCEYVNRAWCDWTGQPLDASLGDGWQQGIHADDLARWRKALARALRDRSAFSVEYRRRRHDGDYLAVVDTGVVRRLENDGCAGLIGHCHELPDARRHAALPAGEAHAADTHPD